MANEEEEFLDDEEEDEDFDLDAEEEMEEVKPKKPKKSSKKSSKKRKPKASDEDEDDEEEEEEEVEAGGGGRGRKRARGGGSLFFEDMAAVDDDEEDEELDEEEGDIIDKEEDLGPEEGGGDGGFHHRALRLREEEGRTEEELAEYLEKKYQDADRFDYDEDFVVDDAGVQQYGLEPTPEDPKLWMVTVKTGHEREVALQLLQKSLHMYNMATPLAIKSVVALDHLKGFVYVEADKEAHVLDAIRGLRTVYQSKGARLVPLKEMTAAIEVNPSAKAPIEPGAWVRPKGGVYKDDLGQVVDVDYAASRATVKLVPRIDFNEMAKEAAGGGSSRRLPFQRKAVRPPQRPFNPEEVNKLHHLPVVQGAEYIMVKSHRFEGPYTVRTISLKGLILVEGEPPLDEVTRWKSYDEKEDQFEDDQAELRKLQQMAGARAGRRTLYVSGDKVVVARGDLEGLEGEVTEVQEETGRLLLRPLNIEGVGELVDVELGEVCKLFQSGDTVRVLDGPRRDETGMVVAADGENVTVLADNGKEQFSVKADQLAAHAPGMDTGVDHLGNQYGLHDCVALDANTAGIILSANGTSARVLTNLGSVVNPEIRVVKVGDVKRKLLQRQIYASDGMGQKVTVHDAVTLQQGPLKGKLASIQAIFKQWLFAICREHPHNGGWVCVPARETRRTGEAVNGAGGSSNGSGSGWAPQSPGRFGAGGDRSSPGSFSGRANGGAYMGSGGRGAHNRGRIGQRVKVRSGPYASYQGRIKQETATHVQLELDAINRIVTVKISDLALGQAGPTGALGGYRGPAGAAAGGLGGYRGGAPATPGYIGATPMRVDPNATPGYNTRTPLGMQTPLHPSQTPLHPSQTPLHPSATPLHGGITATPAHPSFGARTPAHPSQGGGGGDDWYRGGYQPPVGAYAATPGGDGGGYGSFGAPGTAPTPGTAETPGGMDLGVAHTPGIAPTPGGDGYGTAPTPGVAPTPGGMAGTPGYGVYEYAGYGTTPNAAFTPGTVATPGLSTGVTPAVPTPGYSGYGADAGIPSTPGVPSEPVMVSDYRGVLVLLDDGREAEVVNTRPDNSHEVAPVDGTGEMIVIDVLELARPSKGEWVKVVQGERMGLVAQLISIDGTDGVLKGGHVMDLSRLGKLRDQQQQQQMAG